MMSPTGHLLVEANIWEPPAAPEMLDSVIIGINRDLPQKNKQDRHKMETVVED